MSYYRYIFSIVVYRNSEDLIELLDSINNVVKDKCRVIVVNNFFDNDTSNKVFEIAKSYECDFIDSENKGYGSGNNTAMRYALEHYDFQYFIVSNPDIVIKKFNDIDYSKDMGIVAPIIINKNGKHQNPMNVVDCPLATKLIYRGLKLNKRIPFLVGLAINKTVRVISIKFIKLSNKRFSPIYMAHGSFVLFSKSTLDKMQPVYDEEMFLFAEEAFVAWKARKKDIKTYFTSEIQVEHKEDGSMQFRDDISEQLKKSNIHFYESYYSLR